MYTWKYRTKIVNHEYNLKKTYYKNKHSDYKHKKGKVVKNKNMFALQKNTSAFKRLTGGLAETSTFGGLSLRLCSSIRDLRTIDRGEGLAFTSRTNF